VSGGIDDDANGLRFAPEEIGVIMRLDQQPRDMQLKLNSNSRLFEIDASIHEAANITISPCLVNCA
jgi:hypothetical protein